MSLSFKNRLELMQHFCTPGTTAIELGVAKAAFSRQILEHTEVSRLYSVDRWSDHHNEREFRQARNSLKRFGKRSQVIRATFEDALHCFKDETFDVIYIDGYAHTGQEGGETLRDWWNKLKPGGLFSGHDYHEQWQPTVDAVDQFMADYDHQLYTTETDKYPSWFTIKG